MFNSIKSIAYRRAQETLETTELTQFVESADVGDAMLAVSGEPTTDDIYNGDYDDMIDPIEKEVLNKEIEEIKPDESGDTTDDEMTIAKMIGLDKDDPELANVFGMEDDEDDLPEDE